MQANFLQQIKQTQRASKTFQNPAFELNSIIDLKVLIDAVVFALIRMSNTRITKNARIQCLNTFIDCLQNFHKFKYFSRIWGVFKSMTTIFSDLQVKTFSRKYADTSPSIVHQNHLIRIFLYFSP